MYEDDYEYEEEDEEEDEEEQPHLFGPPICGKCGKGVLLKVRVFEGNTYYGCTYCNSIFGLMTYDNGQTRIIGYGKGLRMEEVELGQ